MEGRRDDIEADHALANEAERLKDKAANRMCDLAIEAARRGADKNEALFNAFARAFTEVMTNCDADVKELYK